MEASFKAQCIQLRKEGKSILEIMRATGRPKTSVYFHIKDVPLSPERTREIHMRNGEHIRRFSLARKGKSKRPFRAFYEWDVHSVLLVSHLSFDGEIGTRTCAYNNRNEGLIARVEQLMSTFYDFIPKRYYNERTGVHRIAYFNVSLSAYLNRKAAELRTKVRDLSPELKREYLRAFFDDEGCMDLRPPKHRQVRGYQKDVQVLDTVSNLLREFGIHSRIQKPNEVVITGKQNLIAFRNEINFSPGVRINGARSNSRWRENLEKRALLELAIRSFRN